MNFKISSNEIVVVVSMDDETGSVICDVSVSRKKELGVSIAGERLFKMDLFWSVKSFTPGHEFRCRSL